MLRRTKHSKFEVVAPEEEVYRVSFSWLKRQGRGINHLPTPNVELKNEWS